MALLEHVDPVAGFRFGVEIQGIVVGWFTECGGLSIERGVLPYEEGGLNAYVHQLPKGVRFANITLKRGIADMTLWSWFQQGLYDLKVEPRHVTIILYKGDRTEAERWDLIDAYPVKWTSSELKTEGNQVAIESLTVGQGGGGGASGVVQTMPDELGAEEGSSSPIPPKSAEQKPDIPALADTVYDLLRRELRYERERLGRNRSW